MTLFSAFLSKRVTALFWIGFLLTSCLVQLDEVQGLADGDITGGTGGGVSPMSGGMGGDSETGGSPSGDGGLAETTGGTSGGTGGNSQREYGPNLIENGDFSDGTTGWDNGGLNQLGPPPLMDGMGCTSDGGHTDPPDHFIGWSGTAGGMTLEAGRYQYEFTLRVIGSPDVEVKVASTVPPDYEPTVLRATPLPPPDSEARFEYGFDVASDLTQMGLLFNAKDGAGQACVGDVRLMKVL